MSLKDTSSIIFSATCSRVLLGLRHREIRSANHTLYNYMIQVLTIVSVFCCYWECSHPRWLVTQTASGLDEENGQLNTSWLIYCFRCHLLIATIMINCLPWRPPSVWLIHQLLTLSSPHGILMFMHYLTIGIANFSQVFDQLSMAELAQAPFFFAILDEVSRYDVIVRHMCE